MTPSRHFGLDPLIREGGAAQGAFVGRLDLLRQIAEVRGGRGHVDGPFRFTAPTAVVLPSPQPEGHGDKGQGRSPPNAASAPEIEFGGTAAMRDRLKTDLCGGHSWTIEG
jgi:hypothetical protein